MDGFALHLLRHGAPETPGLMLGRTDVAPTPGGIDACVERAKGLSVEAVVASDLARAARPAATIAAAAGRTATLDPRWRELDFGAWDGLAAAQVDARALARFWDDPDAHPPEGGERWSALTARVGEALAALAPRPTLVVTHGGVLRAALAVLCGFEQRHLWSIDLPYAALLSLRVWPGETPAAQITGLRT